MQQNDSLLRWPQVQIRVGLSRSTAWRLEKLGRFPPLVQISARAVAWRASDIQNFVSNGSFKAGEQ